MPLPIYERAVAVSNGPARRLVPGASPKCRSFPVTFPPWNVTGRGRPGAPASEQEIPATDPFPIPANGMGFSEPAGTVQHRGTLFGKCCTAPAGCPRAAPPCPRVPVQHRGTLFRECFTALEGGYMEFSGGRPASVRHGASL